MSRARTESDRENQAISTRVQEQLTLSKYNEGIITKSMSVNSNENHALSIYLITNSSTDLKNTELYKFLSEKLEKVPSKTISKDDLAKKGGISSNQPHTEYYAITLSIADLKKLDPGQRSALQPQTEWKKATASSSQTNLFKSKGEGIGSKRKTTEEEKESSPNPKPSE